MRYVDDGDLTLTNALTDLAYVHRWTIVPTARPQSVAEHSFAVAALVARLGQALHLRTQAIATLVYLALLHDAEEAITGDIPGNLKIKIAAGSSEAQAEAQAIQAIALRAIPALAPLRRELRADAADDDGCDGAFLGSLVHLADLWEAKRFITLYGPPSGAPGGGIQYELGRRMQTLLAGFDHTTREALLEAIRLEDLR